VLCSSLLLLSTISFCFCRCPPAPSPTPRSQAFSLLHHSRHAHAHATYLIRWVMGHMAHIARTEVRAQSHHDKPPNGWAGGWYTGFTSWPGGAAGTGHDFLAQIPRADFRNIHEQSGQPRSEGFEKVHIVFFGPILKASMVGFTLVSRSYYYLRRQSPGPPFPPDHRQAGERGAIKRAVC
jgi:hypothetical protein